MTAALLLKERIAFDDDSVAELVIWQLPRSVPGSLHSYKYRLAFIVADACVLRYDNETGKGDHRHMLVQDFLADARRIHYENRDS